MAKASKKANNQNKTKRTGRVNEPGPSSAVRRIEALVADMRVSQPRKREFFAYERLSTALTPLMDGARLAELSEETVHALARKFEKVGLTDRVCSSSAERSHLLDRLAEVLARLFQIERIRVVGKASPA